MSITRRHVGDGVDIGGGVQRGVEQELVVAGAAGERVIAGPALEVVVAAQALEHVDAGIADDGLRVVVAGEVDRATPLLLVVVSASTS